MGKDDLREDIAAARSKMQVKLGAGREIKRLAEQLWDNEKVELMCAGQYGAGQGLLVMTDRRLLFVKDGIMAKTTEDFPWAKVSSIQWSSGLATGTLIIFASGARAEIKNVNKSDGKALAEAARGRVNGAGAAAAEPAVHAAAPSAQPAVTTSASDPIEQLRQLGQLRDAGVLTNEEFDAKKAEILARM